jgi:hypothetical protein
MNTFLPYYENQRFSTYSKKPDQKKMKAKNLTKKKESKAPKKRQLGATFFFLPYIVILGYDSKHPL